jgi:hypothetical protein
VNYSELKTAVEDYVENTFSVTDFATMTKLAEQRIYNAVQLPTLRKTSTLSLTGQNVNAPTDFLAAYSLAVVLDTGGYEFLLNKDVNFIRESYPNPAVTGTPRYYALNGTTTPLVQRFLFGPTPPLSPVLSAELNYFYYPESIVTATNTWLGDNFDSVLFNAVLVEAARFMKQEPDIVADVDKQYVQSLTLLKNLGDGKDRTDAYRTGQVRTRVI